MGGCGDFLGNLKRLFDGEIHWDFKSLPFDEQPYHALVGGSDLQVRFDVALSVDAHGCLCCLRSDGRYRYRDRP